MGRIQQFFHPVFSPTELRTGFLWSALLAMALLAAKERPVRNSVGEKTGWKNCCILPTVTFSKPVQAHKPQPKEEYIIIRGRVVDGPVGGAEIVVNWHMLKESALEQQDAPERLSHTKRATGVATAISDADGFYEVYVPKQYSDKKLALQSMGGEYEGRRKNLLLLQIWKAIVDLKNAF